jgi:hypothetical protein
MINQAIEIKLLKIYLLICEKYENELQFHCQRFTNNNTPEFTDQEIITIYLFCVNVERRFKLKEMHRFIKNYFSHYFPKLHSYVAFSKRVNRLAPVFTLLSETLVKEFGPKNASDTFSLLDSMPIITCSGKREGKVARAITNKSYCSTKNLYYFGVKLHALAFYNHNQLPHPESIIITKASENDLTVFKQHWNTIENRTFFGDKIYTNKDFFDELYAEKKSEMLTPIKSVKDQPLILKQWDSAFNFQYSKAVSALRQPIESFFNWLIEKTDIQKASKVRSTNALQAHIFGKLAAAFLTFVF